jgi:hypothetical protein
MSENIHDKGYKRMLSKKKNFLSLLKDFINEPWTSDITEDNLELIDKEFVLKDFTEKEADIIYKVTYEGREFIVYCLLELQSTVDYTHERKHPPKFNMKFSRVSLHSRKRKAHFFSLAGIYDAFPAVGLYGGVAAENIYGYA